MDKITKVSVSGVPEPQGNIYSNCLKVGNQLILSGMIGYYTQQIVLIQEMQEGLEEELFLVGMAK